jgi:hypothetical protein
MSNVITVVIVESKHDPTDLELERTLWSALEEGDRQGFEPLRATAVCATGVTLRREHAANITKWERQR